jgi:hypothetical protein
LGWDFDKLKNEFPSADEVSPFGIQGERLADVEGVRIGCSDEE